MKISELADASGASVPTIKFYIREGLLPAGESVARTRAVYTQAHVRRLELIATLQEELGMSVEKIRDVLRAAEQGGDQLLAVGMHNARAARHEQRGLKGGASPHHEQARVLLEKTASELGWHLIPDDLIAGDVIEAVATLLRVMPDSRIEDSLSDYARAMKGIADQEIPESFDPSGEPWESLRFAVLGTYLIEPLLLSLRRLAHAERTTELMTRRRVEPRGC